tara:strand:+ start:2148 stop:2522 length:375 start_codon:yes stop_codon:yes gene_type:complete
MVDAVLHQEEGRSKVHVHQGVPDIEWGVVDRTPGGQARSIYKDVDFSESVERLGDEAIAVRGFSQIGSDEYGVAPFGLQVRRHFASAIGVTTRDSDAGCTACGKQSGGFFTKALGATCDDRMLV